MPYALSVGLNLGAGNASLALEAQIVNSAGANVGAAITTGFVEFGASGNYQFFTAAMPDGHQGGIVFRVTPGGAVKTFVAINPVEVELSAVVDEAAVAAAVWAYTPRTLTQQIVAVSPPPLLLGDRLTLERGDTWILPITGLGDLTGVTELWFTLKDLLTETDAAAIVQVEMTSGLVVLNGAAGTAADGSIVIDSVPLGNITVTVKAAATTQIDPSRRLYWDIQSNEAGVILTRTAGDAFVSADVTRSIS
jgi:hypothetical protein